MDPRAVPVIGTDAHHPPLPEERLLADSVRTRLKLGSLGPPEFSGDGPRPDLFKSRASAAASVLIPLVVRPEGLNVLLTRRTDHLRDHAGQISFPGGRREAEDVDATAAALREAEEEIGLAPGSVEVLGSLPDYTTVTRFVVTPIVGLIERLPMIKPDPDEVAEVFEVPLRFLMNPAHHRRHVFEADGHRRQFLSMPWVSPEGREFFIWGATAAMLRNFYRLLQR